MRTLGGVAIFPIAIVVSAAHSLELATAAPPQELPANEREQLLGSFLADYWRFPLVAQGRPPDAFSKPEASFEPMTCGGCHPVQFRDWQTSHHARAYSRGFSGQFMTEIENAQVR